MATILVPRAWKPHGQYERMNLVLERMAVRRLDELVGGYPAPDWDGIRTVVSFNPDRASDAALVAAAPRETKVVVHHQRQRRSMLPEVESAVKTALHRANVVVVPAEFLAAEVQSLTSGSIRVVRNGVDDEAFRPLGDRERRERRRRLGIPDGPLAGFVGRLMKAKGFQILERLAESVPPPWHLLVSSVSPALERWGRRFPRVIIHRQAGNDPKAAHPIPLLDVVLSSSLCEVAPLVVTEALMSGVPVVGTRSTPFFDELVRDGFGNAIHVTPLPPRVERLRWRSLGLGEGEATSLAKSIGDALARTNRTTIEARRTIAARARRLGMTAAAMCERYRHLYEPPRH